ncbi:hypothetical protein NQ317_019175 [Molorchus minor]|uniref:ZAD domain-containing protein n=1 Tax=Molorchus minor TaxID=1323400 RepID=A0ABQ9J613_9CUCU|nr:hypothetical protein NQ317_019175 [Molorchus minor]
MEDDKIVVCRLCLNVINMRDSEDLENTVKDLLKALVPGVNLDITIDPRICQHCNKTILRSCKIKNGYAGLHSEVEIKNESKLGGVKIEEGHTKCSICLDVFENKSITDGHSSLKGFRKVFPELSQDPTPCEKCFKAFLLVTEKKKTEECCENMDFEVKTEKVDTDYEAEDTGLVLKTEEIDIKAEDSEEGDLAVIRKTTPTTTKSVLPNILRGKNVANRQSNFQEAEGPLSKKRKTTSPVQTLSANQPMRLSTVPVLVRISAPRIIRSPSTPYLCHQLIEKEDTSSRFIPKPSPEQHKPVTSSVTSSVTPVSVAPTQHQEKAIVKKECRRSSFSPLPETKSVGVGVRPKVVNKQVGCRPSTSNANTSTGGAVSKEKRKVKRRSRKIKK